MFGFNSLQSQQQTFSEYFSIMKALVVFALLIAAAAALSDGIYTQRTCICTGSTTDCIFAPVANVTIGYGGVIKILPVDPQYFPAAGTIDSAGSIHLIDMGFGLACAGKAQENLKAAFLSCAVLSAQEICYTEYYYQY